MGKGSVEKIRDRGRKGSVVGGKKTDQKGELKNNEPGRYKAIVRKAWEKVKVRGNENMHKF